MQLHPRHKTRNLAKAEIMKSFTEITYKYKLTYGEVLDILADLIKDETNHLKEDEDK